MWDGLATRLEGGRVSLAPLATEHEAGLYEAARRSDWRHMPYDASANRERFAAWLAEAIERLIDPHAPSNAPSDIIAILSTAQAALLSTRTGQPESPETIRRMVSRD